MGERERGVGTLGDAIAQAMGALAPISAEREAEWQRQREADELFERHTKRSNALQPIRDQLPPKVFGALVREQGVTETPAIAAVRAWLETPRSAPVLVLSGPTGCGKTVAMAYALAATGGLWVTCTQLTRRSVANFGDEAEDYERTLRARALLLDDVGTERMAPEPVASMLVEVLEKRQGLKTIVTTNLSAADFIGRYADKRLASRIARVEWVECSGEDMRRAK